MKKVHRKRLSQVISGILSAAMSLSVFTSIPAAAENGSVSAVGKTTYTYDDYYVEYYVTDAWSGSQNVELTVYNTGDESILNWALKYDAQGEVSNLWNAGIYEQNDSEYVIRNVDWNFEIAPNQCVMYGYRLTGNDLSLPESFELYSKRVDVTENYDVTYNITNEWDTGVQGEIVITNHAAAPLEAWTLSFDSNFAVIDLWNGRVLENNGTSYTIAAEVWTNPVQPNSSMKIGFTGTKESGVEAVLSNFRLTQVVIGEGNGTATPVDPPASDEKIEITANAAYDEENGDIAVSWDSNKQEGMFDILMSADGENFASVGTVTGVSEYIYTPDNDFETLYFKVVQTVGEQSAKSNIVSVTNTNSSEDIDIIISANGTYDEESGDITISWETNIDNGSFEIFMSEDGEEFTSIGTVEGVSEYVYTPATDFEEIYFKVVQTADNKSAESNVVTVKGSIVLAVITSANFDEETGNIKVSWITSLDRGTYEVFVSEDDENFTSLGIIENAKEYIYTPEGEFIVLYFKVKQTVGELTAESQSAAAYYPIYWEDETDTDNDGLTDVYEKYYFETDPTNPDTDGDGLPDGYEVYYLGTDPNKADSDDNGITDGDEDFDNDGLSNLREYELGTDPNNEDTDSDGLTDGEEVNNYNTDPLNIDTDNDGVFDNDEITLGLDPTSAVTDGIPDSERTFEQSVGADNDNFAMINTDENPFKVSVDVTAAGVAENNLYADESGYAAFVSNDAILGITPEFFYNDKLNVEKITINFDIESEYVANTSGKYLSVSDEFVGIKRFNIFKYFDDIHMLLPIETFHDVENNRVYANVDEMGTYCIIDMEIWFENLGIEPKSAQPQIMALAENNKSIDVIFVLYSNSAYSDYMRAELITTAEAIFNEAEKQNISVRIHYVSWTGDVYSNSNTGEYFAENIEDATAIINRSAVINTSLLAPTDYMLTKAVNGIRNNVSENLQENSNKFCFIIDAGCNPACSSTHGGIMTLQNQGYDFSFIYDRGSTNIANYNSLSSNNSCFQIQIMSGRMMFSDFVIEHLFEEADEPIIIKSNDFKRLPDNFGEISITSAQDYDGDGLLDVDEINFELAETFSFELQSNYSIRGIKFPLIKFSMLLQPVSEEIPIDKYGFTMEEISVLPVYSDLTAQDSDKDGFSDLYESRYSSFMDIAKFDETFVNESTLDDTNVFSSGVPLLDCWYPDCPEISATTIDVIHEETTIDKTAGKEIHTNVYDYSKNILKYTRKCSSTAKYIIEPEENSDYLITLETPNISARTSIIVEEKIADKYSIKKSNYKYINEEKIEYITTEGNSNVFKVNLILERKKKYRISFYGIGFDDDYTLTVEQNNWVHASKGGIKNFNDGVVNITEWYLTKEMTLDLLNKSNDEGTSSIKCNIDLDKYYKLSPEDKLDDCKEIANIFCERFGHNDSISGQISDWATISGRMLLFVPDPSGVTKFVALFVTEAGFVSMLNAKSDSYSRNQLAYALRDGDFNVLFRSESSETFQGASAWFIWENNYINKYDTLIYRYLDVGRFTVIEPLDIENYDEIK